MRIRSFNLEGKSSVHRLLCVHVRKVPWRISANLEKKTTLFTNCKIAGVVFFANFKFYQFFYSFVINYSVHFNTNSDSDN